MHFTSQTDVSKFYLYEISTSLLKMYVSEPFDRSRPPDKNLWKVIYRKDI